MKRILGALCLAGAAAVLTGCATPATTLDAQWVNPQAAAKGTVNNVMVMSVTRDTTNRRLFEDQMVAALQARGVKAVPSYKFIADEGPVEEPRLRKAVTDAGVTYVMLTRVVNVQQQINVTPGVVRPVGPWPGMGWGGFYGFYSGMWAASYSIPPTVTTTQDVSSDTRLFNLLSGEVLWSAATTTSTGFDSVQQIINQFVSLIVTTLGKDGLLPPAKG
jgi:hypothetical protein